MADFYKNKINALRRIDELLAKQKLIETIYFHISTQYGFGKRFVDNRIKALEEIIEIKRRKNG